MYPDCRDGPERPEFAALMAKVESLGVSCELGLLQRHCTAEPLGLFRFGYTPLDGLIRALEDDLKEVGAREKLRATTAENLEYFVSHEDYGFEFHTYQFADRISEDELLRKVAAHFGFLARKLTEELRNGDKLFVYRPESHVPAPQDALRLTETLSRFGSPVLLWVELTNDPARFGTSEWAVPGRMITGYLDWFAGVRYAAAMSFENWVLMLQSAVALWEGLLTECDIKLAAARRARAEGAYDVAFEICSELLARFRDRSEPIVEAANLLCLLGQEEDARTLLAIGLSRFPSDPDLANGFVRLTG